MGDPIAFKRVLAPGLVASWHESRPDVVVLENHSANWGLVGLDAIRPDGLGCRYVPPFTFGTEVYANLSDVMKRLKGETRWGSPPSQSGSSTFQSRSRSSSPPPPPPPVQQSQNVALPFPHMNPANRPQPGSRHRRALPVEKATEPIIGFRRWNLQGGGLWSVGAGVMEWPAGVITAECVGDLHMEPAPVADCAADFIQADSTHFTSPELEAAANRYQVPVFGGFEALTMMAHELAR